MLRLLNKCSFLQRCFRVAMCTKCCACHAKRRLGLQQSHVRVNTAAQRERAHPNDLPFLRGPTLEGNFRASRLTQSLALYQSALAILKRHRAQPPQPRIPSYGSTLQGPTCKACFGGTRPLASALQGPGVAGATSLDEPTRCSRPSGHFVKAGLPRRETNERPIPCTLAWVKTHSGFAPVAELEGFEEKRLRQEGVDALATLPPLGPDFWRQRAPRVKRSAPSIAPSCLTGRFGVPGLVQ